MCALARAARLEPPPSPAQMTPIPASCDRLLRSGVVPIMSENAAPQDLGAGDDLSVKCQPDVLPRRAKLLTTKLAEECVTKLFTERADGPHASNLDLISIRPTVEEIVIAQAAVLGAIGEKGSDKRARANSLCADRLIDLEQGLGYLLCDRFAGTMPTPMEARGVGKRAADKPPGKKQRERWKEKAKAARQAAKKTGADDEAVAAAGQAARAKAEAAFVEVEVVVSGLERPAAAPEPSTAALEPEPAPEPDEPQPPAQHECSEECSQGICPRARAMHDMLTSPEATAAIAWAFRVVHLSRFMSPQLDEELDLSQARAAVKYRHALRRLQLAYPDVAPVCELPQNSTRQMIELTVRMDAMGLGVAAARTVAQEVGFDFERAVTDYRNGAHNEACA